MWFKKLFARPAPAPQIDPPRLTAAAIAEAKQNPNGWVYAMDGVADPNGDVPPQRIRGAWKVNSKGEIEGEFIPNPNYRPIEPVKGGNSPLNE